MRPPVGETRMLRVPLEHPSIQAAIDAAQDGDTVEVGAGVWTGPGNRALDLRGRDIIVRSAAGAESTMIDCQEGSERAGPGFLVHSGESRHAAIEGFTIRDAGSGSAGSDAAIICDGASPSIRDCRFLENPGGCLKLNESTSAISGCVLENPSGRTVTIESSRVSFDRCVIRGHRWLWVSAVDCVESYVTFLDCELSGNVSEAPLDVALGGAVSVRRGHAAFQGCLLARNGASKGGGGIYASSSSIELTGCTVAENRVDGHGSGGLYLDGASSAVIAKSILTANCALGTRDLGGSAEATASLTDCAVDSSGIRGLHRGFDGALITGDPGLCRLSGCETAEPSDYRLRNGSACAEAGIGAFGIGCEVR
ncbi:MAG: right-handed parallel beta-helix repeat-containing protein [Candidatus Eisenbacteria bacterium]|nr:right-handed parallel beta-helix repeat-containing protein [Candidatus Eisenbacteria bacterium]